jgi:predicted aspartyl protease
MKAALFLYHRCLVFLLIISIGVLPAFVHRTVCPGDETYLMLNTAYPLFSMNSADPEVQGEFNSITIPLKRAGRLFLVEAVIDGVSGNLVFDTGATGLVLNKTYFRDHSLVGGSQSNGITGSTGNIDNTFVNEVRLSELYYKNIRADVADLSHIENRRGVKIIGLMGFNMIRSMEIVIDASHNELQLHRIDKKGNRLQPEEAMITQDHTQKIEPWHPVLIVKADIGGRSLKFCFDTGAETNAINSSAPKCVLSTISITRRSKLGGAGKATNEVLAGSMGDFKLDKTPITDMETVIADLNPLSEVYGTNIDGMLGFNFLEKGVITINLVKKQFSIHFIKLTE